MILNKVIKMKTGTFSGYLVAVEIIPILKILAIMEVTKMRGWESRSRVW